MHRMFCIYRTGSRDKLQAFSAASAVQVNIAIMRAFVKLREMIASDQRPCPMSLDNLEQKYDSQFKVVFDAIRHNALVPYKKRKIGFEVRREWRDTGHPDAKMKK